jgi:hypothetical protein
MRYVSLRVRLRNANLVCARIRTAPRGVQLEHVGKPRLIMNAVSDRLVNLSGIFVVVYPCRRLEQELELRSNIKFDSPCRPRLI